MEEIASKPHEHAWGYDKWETLCHNGRRIVHQCNDCLAVRITFRTHNAGEKVVVIDPPYVKD
jgi:hypothetical protein